MAENHGNTFAMLNVYQGVKYSKFHSQLDRWWFRKIISRAVVLLFDGLKEPEIHNIAQ